MGNGGAASLERTRLQPHDGTVFLNFRGLFAFVYRTLFLSNPAKNRRKLHVKQLAGNT
jgi:hypothetical protein